VAVAAEPAPRTSWWRIPVMAFGLAGAAAAVLLVQARPRPAPPSVAVHHRAPLPPVFDVEDLDVNQLAAVNAALADDYADAPDDEELAQTSPAAPENLVESLSDADATRVRASL
jgi:hypothetical protein